MKHQEFVTEIEKMSALRPDLQKQLINLAPYLTEEECNQTLLDLQPVYQEIIGEIDMITRLTDEGTREVQDFRRKVLPKIHRTVEEGERGGVEEIFDDIDQMPSSSST